MGIFRDETIRDGNIFLERHSSKLFGYSYKRIRSIKDLDNGEHEFIPISERLSFPGFSGTIVNKDGDPSIWEIRAKNGPIKWELTVSAHDSGGVAKLTGLKAPFASIDTSKTDEGDPVKTVKSFGVKGLIEYRSENNYQSGEGKRQVRVLGKKVTGRNIAATRHLPEYWDHDTDLQLRGAASASRLSQLELEIALLRRHGSSYDVLPPHYDERRLALVSRPREERSR